MSSSSEWGCKSKKLKPITVNYSSYIRLWLVNFLLLQPHPLLLLLIVDHALLCYIQFWRISKKGPGEEREIDDQPCKPPLRWPIAPTRVGSSLSATIRTIRKRPERAAPEVKGFHKKKLRGKHEAPSYRRRSSTYCAGRSLLDVPPPTVSRRIVSFVR